MSAVIRSYKKITPKIGKNVFIAETAAIIGDVEIGDQSSVWYGCTLRGDVNHIRIGSSTNIQDGVVIHCASKENGDIPTIVGDDCTIGHQALLHACTIGNRVLIGMQACIMDGASVGDEAIVAAGALVTPGKKVLTGQLWAGRPAKYVRELTADERKHLSWSAQHYVRLAKDYL
ncbi:MAG: gamma carbonic anhydrase family protein [Alphaproteobacteria bacterium]|nr:MAG: gamma carbonic anhydrase family protein [Alphaproteobacteria bacterium]